MDVLTLLLQTCVLLLSMSCQSETEALRKYRRRRLTAEEQLIMDLFRGYDTDARAVVDTQTTVTVQIQFLLLRIQKLDERSQVLQTTGLLISEWRDERLTWDPTKYSNLSDLVVSANRIWLPELAIINGADENIQDFEKIRVLISSDGKVHWEPGGVFETTCDIDITYFPFDFQNCPIEIGAWSYKSSRMNLTNISSTMETQEYKLNGEWDILRTTAEWREIVLPCCPDIRYSKVVFNLNMKRRYAFYIMNIILPCALLSTLILIVFCVPPDAGEKISAGISVLLAFTVFLLMLADNVPRTSLNVPILVLYLGSTLSLGTASVCISVLVLNFHHKGSHTRMPRWARVFFLQHLARLFGFPVRHFSPPRVRERPNNCKPEDPDGADPMEVQSILSPGEKARRMPGDNYIVNETLHYHNIDVTQITTARGQQSETNLSDHQQPHNEAYAKEWHMLARVLDRLFFFIMAFITLLSACLILLSPWYIGKQQ